MKRLPTCLVFLWCICSCKPSAEQQSHAYMQQLLKETALQSAHPGNLFDNATRIRHFDSLFRENPDRYEYLYQKALDLLGHGDAQAAATVFDKLLQYRKQGRLHASFGEQQAASLESYLALSYLRLGEQENCIINHTSASCLFPVQPAGFHQLPEGSRNAIRQYTDILRQNPDDLSARWLLNIAYMTLGQYPGEVPPQWLIPDSCFQSDVAVKRFQDIASQTGFDIRGLSGGLIVDDLTGDGYLDILISEWGPDKPLRFFVNNADGSFTEKTQEANLSGLYGGLNMIQADYNNDGWLDVFVLRGAWLGTYGNHPNSLLKNNGDGTFTDVTAIAGLLSFHPTQTATWNDFNRDGWIDLFIGNETSSAQAFHPCELYLNNRDGTFREAAEQAGVAVSRVSFRINPLYVKGVTSGDYDNDGWPDLYVSTGGGTNLTQNFLFRNQGVDKQGLVSFKDITREAGLGGTNSTFTTWFWDYDNDGWLDILAAGYWKGQGGTITQDLAAEYLGMPYDAQKGLLYRNKGGTHTPPAFKDVSQQTHLDRILYAMGANFGDFDNDGWLDMYLGTGDPSLGSVMPNLMFRNAGGQYFQDVTTAAGVGHLQKGHAVAFSDIDNDGDRDLLMSMGGAFQGDVFQNAWFENPYQDHHHWITLRLEGTRTNRAAIGTRVALTIKENGQLRKIYRDVNAGGSFGASTLRLEVGIGEARQVEAIDIFWPNSPVQQFHEVAANRFYHIKEGDPQLQKVPLKRLKFDATPAPHDHHAQRLEAF